MRVRSEEHTSELQSPCNLVCRLLLEKKKTETCTVRSSFCWLGPTYCTSLLIPSSPTCGSCLPSANICSAGSYNAARPSATHRQTSRLDRTLIRQHTTRSMDTGPRMAQSHPWNYYYPRKTLRKKFNNFQMHSYLTRPPTPLKLFFFFLMSRPPPRSPLFPSTPLSQ